MSRGGGATRCERLGGEARLRARVDRFYDPTGVEPAFAAIRRLHPANLESLRAKLFIFLSGWLGGLPVYVARYHHPMLRAPHLPFAIGSAERKQWMQGMIRAMEETRVEAGLRAALADAFAGTADWLRNRPR